MLNATRPSSTRPFVASSSNVARVPSVVPQAQKGVRLAPLIDSLKADQLKQNLPQVGWWLS